MRKQTERKLMAGILAAVMMVTSVPETVYAIEQAGGKGQENSASVEAEINADEKVDSEDKIEAETSDEKNDEEESQAAAPDDEIDNDDVNEEGISDQDNASEEENESEMPEQKDDDGEIAAENVMTEEGTEESETVSKIEEEIIVGQHFVAKTMYESEFDRKLSDIRTVFPDGSKWDERYKNASKGNRGWQCFGYAHWAANYVFGLTVWGADDSFNWTKVYNMNSVKAGDIVQYGNPSNGYGHTIFVTAVSGNTIKYTDANSDYKNTVKWEQMVTKNATLHGYTFSYVQSGPGILSQPEVGSDMPGPFTRTIADGDYHIVTALDDSMCLDIDGVSYENGATAKIFHSTEYEYQVFTVTWLGADKGYKIIHRESGKSLDVEGASRENGANVWQWEYYDPSTHTQDWIINEVDQGAYYTIQSRGSGYYLDVAGGVAADNTNVQIYKWVSANNLAQRWRFIPAGTRTIPDGDYYIMTDVAGNMCLDIQGASTADEANVIISGKTGRNSQVFTVSYLNNGFYKILNRNSGKSLDVYIGSAIRGTNVQQYSDHGGTPQQWTIRESGDDFYYIQPRCSGHYLDVADGKSVDGTNVWTTVWMGGAAAQKWKFEPVVKPKLNPPTASKPSGSVVEGGTRLFLDGGGADHVYFTWDGTDPRTSSTRYSYYGEFFNRSGIPVFSTWETMTIKAYAVKEGYQDSNVVEFTYIVAENQKLSPPTASLPSGMEVEAGTEVSLISGMDGAAIYYTLDGTNPSQESFHYSRPFIIEKDTVITACVVKDGYEDSDQAVFTYTVKSRDNYGKGDVLDEDIPQGKVENIPQGLWMSAVSSQVYTGKAIKPQVRVYDHTTLLTEKKDYTISYKNNVKANIVSGVNVPTITVTGKGNYTGKEVQTFVIRPKRLSDVDIMADDITLQYNGKVQKTLPVLTWNGKKLARNKDYTVSYPDEESDGVADPMAYIKVGTYTVLMKGMGNYTGEKTINLTITQSKSASTMTIAKIADHTYTGNEVRPVLVVKNGKVVLTEGEDYEVSYQNNIKVGTATVMITGKGSYVGVKKAAFKIVPRASLNKARAEMEFDSPLVYNGRAVRPDRCQLTVSEKNADGRTVTITLTENDDYKVSYLNDNKAGRATVIFQGVNGYSGTLKKTYKIEPYDIGKDETDLTEADQQIRIELADSYAYVKGGCKPEPVVTYQGRVLTKGTDYTLSYKNNSGLNDGSNPRKQPIVIVKGKGSFKGTREKTYRITSKRIDRATMTAVDRVWQNKGNIYKTKVVIKDEDGRALNAGKDYDSTLTYAYSSDTVLSDGTLREAGEHVAAQDIIPAGTVIRVTAAAKGSNYFGTVSCVYRITKADIGKAAVTIPAQSYTGRAIMPENEIRIKMNGKILPEENYQITGYSNNINKGTATVTISGINDCGGTKTAKFKIKGKGFLWWWR